MPISLKDLPLDGMPVEMSRSLTFNDPAILNYADKINESAGLPKGLLRSTIENGEKSNPLDVSTKKARGVGQFTPDTAKRYGLADPTDPKASIEAMARYYKDAINTTKSLDPKILAAAYNAGMNRKELKAGNVPNIPETKAYVQRVAAHVAPAPKGMSLADIEAAQKVGDEKVSPLVSSVKPTSGAATFMHAAVENVLPSVAGLASFGAGAWAGAELMAPTAPFTGGIGPVIGGLVGGLTTSFGGASLTSWAQDKLARYVPDTLSKFLGMDKANRMQEESEHPYLNFAGGATASMIGMKPGFSTVKNAMMMAGVNTSVEAAQELHKDGKLDPGKMAIAAGVGALVNKPTTIGKHVMDATAPHWHPLSGSLPKKEYVEEVVKKGGEKLREGAEQLWDHTNRATEVKYFNQPAVLPGATTAEHVKFLDDAQFSLRQQRDADNLAIADYLKQMKPEEFAAASSENVYHAQPSEANAPTPTQVSKAIAGSTRKGTPQLMQAPETKQAKPSLTPDEAYANERWVKPLRERNDALYARILATGDQDAAAFFEPNGHNVRIQQSNWINKLASIGRNVMGQASGGRFAATPGSMMPRSMYAINFENGPRQVIHLNGRELGLYTTGKQAAKPTQTVNLDRAPKVGDTVTVLGRKGTITQATTKEIEAATTYKYNKNALANYLWMNKQMESYLREHDYLKHTLDALKVHGYAIPTDEVRAQPRGYQRLEGGPKMLRDHWIKDEIAYVLKDGLLRDPEGSLSTLNSMAVGSMFWNPTGHLMNGFDHYLTTVMGGILKPWRWGTLARSVAEAYKDVRDLGPAYRSYLSSGMGLNYGRVAAESIYEGMLKGISTDGWNRISAEWGMKPADMIKGIYATSRHALWAGSDMMMISAHKYMASVHGRSIFDKAIRNHVETHNPNYRIPPQVGFDGFMKIPGMPEAAARAISRGISLAMQSRAFNMFGRYHYGQFRSAGRDIHDFIFQNEKSQQTRSEALAHMAATAFMLTVVYPYIFDTLAKVVSGDPSAQARRAGASTVPYTMWHLVLGDETVNKLMSEAWNLPPVPKTIIETAQNRNLFTGQHIWNPQDTLPEQAYDWGTYVGGQVMQPIRAIEEPGKTAAQSVGIQTDQARKQAILERIKKRDIAEGKRRRKKRGF